MFLVQKQCLSSKIWERELPASQETPDQPRSFCRDYLLPSSWGTLSPLWAPGLLSPLLFDPIPYFTIYFITLINFFGHINLFFIYHSAKRLSLRLANSLANQGFQVVGKPCKLVVTCMETIANGHMFASWVTSLVTVGLQLVYARYIV